jgi:hypothetical protein
MSSATGTINEVSMSTAFELNRIANKVKVMMKLVVTVAS